MPAATGVPDNGKPAAEVNNCSTTIEGNDAMQFNVGSITVPSSCSEFTITLEHTGQLPVAAMGHNVVISQAADREAIASAGMSAGVEGDYVDPDDERVIAHTELIGGGETTSVTFDVSEIQGDGPYEFFCSFPGHWAIMRGSIQVG
ncbi:MAG: azurin [Lysobacter spongiicola]|nr:azurin [Lysobacter spongiicola]